MIYITFFIVILIDKRGVREALRERERENQYRYRYRYRYEHITIYITIYRTKRGKRKHTEQKR